MKRIGVLFVTIIIIMLLSISTSALSESGSCGPNLSYTYNNKTGEVIISGTGKMSDNAFYRSEIKSVVIGDGVTSIGKQAFAYSTIESVKIGDFVSTIGVEAFCGCEKLESIEIPDDVTQIGHRAFAYTSSLSFISIGCNVSGIGHDTFLQSNNVEKIVVNEENTRYSTDDIGCLFNKDKTVLIKYPSGNKINEYLIPDSVKFISAYSFYNAINLSHINIPNSVEVIEELVFRGCKNLVSINIPDSVKEIGAGAFLACKTIKSVTIGNGLEELLQVCDSGYGGEYSYAVFEECIALEKITVSEENEYFSSGEYGELFNKDKTLLIQYPIGSEIEKYTIPDGVVEIDNYAFKFCDNIINVIIPNSVTTIGNYIFYDCDNLESIVIPDSVTEVGSCVFMYCSSLKSAVISKNITEISFAMFDSCKSLTHIIIPNGVTLINDWAFYNCENLLSVTIPKSVMKINDWAFIRGESLANVYYVGTENEWNAITFDPTYNTDLVNSTIHYNHRHSYVSRITTQPTCTQSGVITYICDFGDYYTEIIPAIDHEYKTEVTSPTCYERGFTTHTCECGYSFVDDYVDATGHSYTSKITTPATHTATGIITFTCTCGDTYTQVIEKHNYESVVTAPTCTEQGYTTYTCECNDSYVSDYVDELGHTEDIIPAVAPTCIETGLTEGAKCSVCGEILTEQETVNALGHTTANAVEENYVAPTCTENGSKDVVVYCSACDEEISRETVTVEPTGHADNDGDGYCDGDNELLDPSVDCNCNCHKSGISKFFFDFILFFQRLFGSNKTCACGVAHY